MIKSIDDEYYRIRNFLLQHKDALRLIAKGMQIPYSTVSMWIKERNIPPDIARAIYRKYRQVEAYNLKLQGKLEEKHKEDRIRG